MYIYALNEIVCGNSKADLDYFVQMGIEPNEHIVYWYESGSYEGSGALVRIKKDKTVELYNLSHCSCYGPLDGFEGRNGEHFSSMKDMLEKCLWLDDYTLQPVIEKLKELFSRGLVSL